MTQASCPPSKTVLRTLVRISGSLQLKIFARNQRYSSLPSHNAQFACIHTTHLRQKGRMRRWFASQLGKFSKLRTQELRQAFCTEASEDGQPCVKCSAGVMLTSDLVICEHRGSTQRTQERAAVGSCIAFNASQAFIARFVMKGSDYQAIRDAFKAD